MRPMSKPPPIERDRQAYLALLSATVGRMSMLGAAIKGWGVTLLAGLFVVARPTARVEITAVMVIAVLCLWMLDAHLMGIEKTFRARYERVRSREAPADFSMEPAAFERRPPGWAKIFSNSRFLTGFWAGLLALAIAGAFILRWAASEGS